MNLTHCARCGHYSHNALNPVCPISSCEERAKNAKEGHMFHPDTCESALKHPTPYGN